MRKLALLLIAALLLVAVHAYGPTARSLLTLAVLEDRFYNYDFTSRNVSSSNVDWPVTMVFYGNADVNKIKGIYFGPTVLANPMYAYLDDGDGWVWDEDRGTKSGFLTPHYSKYLRMYVYLHMRIYAPNPPDYMYNQNWGRYVLATTHYDEWPWEGWSGYSEYAEKDFAEIASSKGYYTLLDYAYFYNYEPFDDKRDPGHIWLSNGYATFVYTP